MSSLELVATILGVACVGLTIIRNIWCWPVGLAMVLCYIVIFHGAKLYSDMGLQVVYVGLQIYGWWYWARVGRPDPTAPIAVHLISLAAAGGWLVTAIIATAALGTTMARLTDAALPYWDAATTVLSLIAQWLMGRKIIESWLVWIVVDVLSIGIYLTKELQLTAGLYALFLVMATIGFVAWWRAGRRAVAAPVPTVAADG